MSQVVCIVDGGWLYFWGDPVNEPFPALNEVCTITGHKEFLGTKYYHLAGFKGVWESTYFKPLKKTDISCFTRMLKTRKLEDV